LGTFKVPQYSATAIVATKPILSSAGLEAGVLIGAVEIELLSIDPTPSGRRLKHFGVHHQILACLQRGRLPAIPNCREEDER